MLDVVGTRTSLLITQVSTHAARVLTIWSGSGFLIKGSRVRAPIQKAGLGPNSDISIQNYISLVAVT